MRSYKFNLFNKFHVVINSETKNPILNFLLEEYKYFYALEPVRNARVGEVYILDKITLLEGTSIFVENSIFFHESILIICMSGKYLKIYCKDDHFKIEVEKNFNSGKAFYIFEVFLRLYATLHDIVFLHSSSFLINGKSCIVNAFGGTGKTNLLLDILEAGGCYLSDDLSAMDSSNFIYPYVKRLNLLDYNFKYKPYLLEKLNKKSLKTLIIVKEILKGSNNPILRKIRDRIGSRINIRVDYQSISNNVFEKDKRDIDNFIWLERNTFDSGTFDVSSSYYASRMNACLQMETRAAGYIVDYIGIINPFIIELINKQKKLIYKISENNEIFGFKKKYGDERAVKEYVNDLCD